MANSQSVVTNAQNIWSPFFCCIFRMPCMIALSLRSKEGCKIHFIFCKQRWKWFIEIRLINLDYIRFPRLFARFYFNFAGWPQKRFRIFYNLLLVVLYFMKGERTGQIWRSWGWEAKYPDKMPRIFEGFHACVHAWVKFIFWDRLPIKFYLRYTIIIPPVNERWCVPFLFFWSIVKNDINHHSRYIVPRVYTGKRISFGGSYRMPNQIKDCFLTLSLPWLLRLLCNIM